MGGAIFNKTAKTGFHKFGYQTECMKAVTNLAIFAALLVLFTSWSKDQSLNSNGIRLKRRAWLL